MTIIIGTNRPDSMSGKVAAHYAEMLIEKGVKPQIYNLANLPETFLFSELYGKRSEQFSTEIETYVSLQSKFIFVIPEYNGGFPGALKAFIDAVPPAEWQGKKAALIGVAAGRAGAARAMDQFTNILNYLKVNVFFSKPKLSGIGKLMEGDKLTDKTTLDMLDSHADGFMKF